MMLHKGDLVKGKDAESIENDYNYQIEAAVVLCDPYVTIVSQYTGDGNALYSCEKIVVDILCGETFLGKVPINALERYNT